MSSTSNAQDLLVNVFRPTYRWDPTTGFVPSLTVSNVNEIITDRITTDVLVVTDIGNNTYIGSNAGLFASNTAYNVGLGYQAMGGAINSSNNVAVGYYALDGVKNSTSNVVLGSYSGLTGSNGGTRNILIGPNVTVGTGSGNILIGVDISLASGTNRFQLGRLLYGDLSTGFIGVNTDDPKGAFDVSGTTFFRGKVGIQTTQPNPKYSLDINGSIFANDRYVGGRGTFRDPVFTFDDVSGSGMYLPTVAEGYGDGAFGITVNRGPAAIFSDNCVNLFQNLDVSGTFSARSVNLDAFAVTNGSRAAPTISFVTQRREGFYHLLDTCGFALVTAGQDRMMFLESGDISSSRILGSDISLGGTILTSTGTNVIGGVTLGTNNITYAGTISNTNTNTSNRIGGITLNNNSITYAGSITGSSDGSTNRIGGVTLGNSNITYAGAITGSVDTTSNRIGGVTLANSNITYAGAITGSTANTSNEIGGVTFSNFDISMVGRILAQSSVSNQIGGVTLNSANISYAGTISNTNTNTSNQIGGVTLSNTDITYAGRISNTNNNTSNQIGGVTFSNFDLSMIGRIIGLSSVSNQIGGVTLSNTDISYAGTITGSTSNTSNRIGGITLSNNSITYVGSITGSSDGSSNRIGGVTLGNTSITYAGAITGSTVGASNQIGGVTLSNANIRFGGNIIGSVDTLSNRIGGVALNNTNITYAGAITGSTANTSNHIGGVTLSNFDLSLAAEGRIFAPVLRNALNPTIFDISEGNISNSRLTRSSNFRGSNGTVAAPTYSFISDPSAGIHWPGVSQIAFDTSGIQRMCISGGFVGIGTTAPVNALDVSGVLRIIGPNGNIVFSNGTINVSGTQVFNTTGALSNDAGTSNSIGGVTLTSNNITYGGLITGTVDNASNRIGGVVLNNTTISNSGFTQSSNFRGSNGTVAVPTYSFISDPSAGIHWSGVSQIAFDTSGFQRMCISGGFVGIATATPATPLDVSGTIRSINFRGLNGTVAAPTYGFTNDPSAGIHWPGVSQIAFDTSGVQRMCISGGFVGIGTANPRVALEVVGDVSATTYNGPGGTALLPHYTFSDDRTTGMFFPAANSIGLTAGGIQRMCVSGAFVGINTSTPINALDVSGVLRIIGPNGNITFSNGTINLSGTEVFNTTGALSNLAGTSNSIGGVTLTNSNITYAGAITGSTATTSNQIGGVTFSNSDLSMSSSGLLLASVIRDSRTPMLFDISRGNVLAGSIQAQDDFVVAVGDYIATSSAPYETWTRQTATVNNGREAAWNGNLWVVGAYSSPQLQTSPDGVTWTVRASHPFTTVLHVAWGNGLWLAVGTGTSDTLATSTDGNTWTGGGKPSSSTQLNGAIWTGTQWIVVGGTASDGLILTSATGTGSWTSRTNGLTRANGVAADGTSGRVVVVGEAGVAAISISTDGGVTFTNLGYSSGSFQSVAWNGSLWVVVGQATGGTNVGIIFTSSDGTTWTQRTSPSADAWRSVVWSGSRWIVGGNATNALATSLDGITWTSVTQTAVTIVQGLGTARRITSMRPAGITTSSLGIGMSNPIWSLDISGPGVRKIQVSGQDAAVNVWDQRVADPAVLFQNAANYGIYSSNALPFYLWQSNDVRMCISAGNVGIGTLAPGAALDVATGPIRVQRPWTGVSNAFVITDSTGTLATRWGLGVINAATGSGSGGNDFIINSYTDAGAISQAFTIRRSNGNVGIATNAPTHTLDVSAGTIEGFRVTRTSGGTALFDVRPENGYATVTTNGFFNIYKSGTTNKAESNKLAQFAGDDGGKNYFMSNEVGIGMSNPVYLLDISSATDSQGIRITGVNAQVNVQNPGFSPLQVYQSSVGQGFYTVNSLPLNLYQNGGLRMCISGGLVGINTETPLYQLDVNGSFAANSNEYTVYVTATSNVSVPSGFTKAYIIACGGGGGGGGAGSSVSPAGGGGGGGSGYVVEALLTTISEFTVTIGAGGTAGAIAGAGGTGGNTTIAYGTGNAPFRAVGGSGGGAGAAISGGVGGAGSYGGGGGGAKVNGGTGASGGAGKRADGDGLTTATSTAGGNGGRGGGANNLGSAFATEFGGGGGGGAPSGGGQGGGSTPGSTSFTGLAGRVGGGGGGGCGAAGGAGGSGYAIIKFLR
jgi:hypothetical protein